MSIGMPFELTTEAGCSSSSDGARSEIFTPSASSEPRFERSSGFAAGAAFLGIDPP